ncbi:PQQ-binding-like beta-propeller repeat protein [bacterium]|nr:PQQ-binding-like beta-propeller repeat protein [bacterium]
MPFLEIIHMTGEIDQRKLSKQQPLTVGSHASTDIVIDEDDVEIMHCRVSWGKQGYEAVAAGTEPISVNGNLVKNATLKAGDVLRFGTVDVRYRESADDGFGGAVEQNDGNELGLKPLTGEFESPRPTASQKAKSAVDEINEDDIIDDDLEVIDDLDVIDEEDEIPSGGGSLADGLAALAAAEGQSETPATGSKSKKKSKPKPKPTPAAKQKNPAKPAATKSSTPAAKAKEPAASPKAPIAKDDGMSPRMREAMRNQRRRPGEEDPLRSPLVLGLVGGAAALALTGLIFFFIASRQTTQQRYDQAKAVYDEGKFQNAITEFQNFIIAHPRQDLTEEAKTLMGLAKVRQQIESATPDFPEGLDQLRIFIRDNSDREDAFEALHPEIVRHARTIALEAAVTAGKRFDEELLKISSDARTILNTYAPKDSPPTETLNQIEASLRASKAMILKNSVFKEHLARMEKALSDEDPSKTSPLEAMKARRDLLVRYPRKSPNDRTSFETNKEIVSNFNKAIELEKKKVVSSDNDTPALVDDHSIDAKSLTLAFHGRTKIDEVSVGKSVIVVAKDCCYGVDFVTGEPIWRRVIGFDTPFFPLQEAQLPSVVLFDTNNLELVRLNQTTGQLVWRLPINDFAFGQPLLVDKTVYLSTESGRLLAVDLETGLLAGELQFSQPISGPVQLKDDQYLFVAGNEEVSYTLSKRPFACTQVSYLGHQPASIAAPLLEMGPYVLMIENKTDSASLRLLDVSDPKVAVTQVSSETVGSRVIDQPVIRGRNLFVPATGESIHVFAISDDPGQPPMTTGPIFDGQGTKGESINLLTGPNGQVWMSTDALNRLQLTTDSLQPDGNPSAAGIATQPLQMVSGFLLNARRRPFTDAVTFTRTNREDMTSDWQSVLGGKLLATTGSSGDSINMASVNEAGHVFRIGSKQLADGKFVTDATVRLPLNPDLETPLIGAAVAGNRLAVACGNPEPRLWIINAAGQIEGSPRIPEPLQASPSSIGDRIVLPMKGRLSVARLSGQAAVQDFILPSGEEQEWRSVVPAGEDQVVAVTKSGLVLLLKLQASPRPHLSEVARLELGAKVLFEPAANDKMVAIVDASKKVTLFDTVRLDQISSRQFDQPLTNHPFIVNNLVVVEAGSQTMHAMSFEQLQDSFTLPLNSVSLAGITQLDSTLYVAQQNGKIQLLNASSGEVTKAYTLNSILSDGVIRAEEELFFVAVDGTLFQLGQ